LFLLFCFTSDDNDDVYKYEHDDNTEHYDNQDHTDNDDNNDNNNHVPINVLATNSKHTLTVYDD